MLLKQNLWPKQSIKRAQKWRFSQLKKPQTPNQEHDYHPALTILTILFSAWKQYRQFIHSFCRDPVGAGKTLPRELCEFWKEKESLKSDISTSWCTQEGHVSISQDGHPRTVHAQSKGCSHPVLLHGTIPPSPPLTHLWDPWDGAPRTETIVSNHNLWGQSKKEGDSV